MAEKILLGHGSGGKLMSELIENVIRGILGEEAIQLDDSAVFNIGDTTIAFTTDSFTVSPIFFPGGDIGKLAVNGTVNDLSVMGSKPLFLSCGVIVEEGLDVDVLKRILQSMREAADYAGVRIVTGDTKVVQKGTADRIFINTSGIGIIEGRVQRLPVEAGDAVIINGCIGDHGIAVMAERNKLSFTEGLSSDCAPLNHLIQEIVAEFPDSIKFMRDPTRGGVASVLHEIVRKDNIGIRLIEDQLPIRDEVKGVCELLGLDPLYVANEGKVILIARGGIAADIVSLMRSRREGSDAAVIGEVTLEPAGKVYLKTSIGGSRILPLLTVEQLPRIC
jgi:hydrogenase expression/formation protein HypE